MENIYVRRERNRRAERKALVVINEQHSLLKGQEDLLSQFESFEIVKVPATGWTISEMREVFSELHERAQGHYIVFASPIPVLIKWFTEEALDRYSGCWNYKVLVFHNDQRDKKELPDGKVIYTVAQDGWELI